jgi:hypothetical protein
MCGTSARYWFGIREAKELCSCREILFDEFKDQGENE